MMDQKEVVQHAAANPNASSFTASLNILKGILQQRSGGAGRDPNRPDHCHHRTAGTTTKNRGDDTAAAAAAAAARPPADTATYEYIATTTDTDTAADPPDWLPETWQAKLLSVKTELRAEQTQRTALAEAHRLLHDKVRTEYEPTLARLQDQVDQLTRDKDQQAKELVEARAVQTRMREQWDMTVEQLTRQRDEAFASVAEKEMEIATLIGRTEDLTAAANRERQQHADEVQSLQTIVADTTTRDRRDQALSLLWLDRDRTEQGNTTTTTTTGTAVQASATSTSDAVGSPLVNGTVPTKALITHLHQVVDSAQNAVHAFELSCGYDPHPNGRPKAAATATVVAIEYSKNDLVDLIAQAKRVLRWIKEPVAAVVEAVDHPVQGKDEPTSSSSTEKMNEEAHSGEGDDDDDDNNNNYDNNYHNQPELGPIHADDAVGDGQSKEKSPYGDVAADNSPFEKPEAAVLTATASSRMHDDDPTSTTTAVPMENTNNMTTTNNGRMVDDEEEQAAGGYEQDNNNDLDSAKQTTLALAGAICDPDDGSVKRQLEKMDGNQTMVHNQKKAKN